MSGALMMDDQADDRGADGPAALARESRIVPIEGRSGGSGKAKGVEITARRLKIECRLDDLFANGVIDGDQRRAGLLFRRHWHATHGSVVKVGSYGDRVDKAYSIAAIEERSSSLQAIDQAMALLTDHERKVIVSVCGQDERGRLDWRMQFLREGLDKLVAAWVKPLGELRQP